jgi:hypothetical protein
MNPREQFEMFGKFASEFASEKVVSQINCPLKIFKRNFIMINHMGFGSTLFSDKPTKHHPTNSSRLVIQSQPNYLLGPGQRCQRLYLSPPPKNAYKVQ